MYLKIFLFFILVTSTSCSSRLVVLKPHCSELNWFERGRQDGMQGQPSNNWTMKSDDCEQMEKEEIQNYMDGWNHGLALYCTREHGFATAKAGAAYQKTCPEKYEEDFLKGYEEGLNVFIVEKETSQIIAQIEQAELQLKKTPLQNREEIQKTLKALTEKKVANLKTLEKYNNPVAR